MSSTTRTLHFAISAPRSSATAEILGLKHAPTNELGWATLAQTGLPSSVVVAVARVLGWTRHQLVEALDLVPRTVARRLRRKELLTTPESERVLRLARILARATEVLEGPDKARAWLVQPSVALGDRSPLELLRTDIGTELVQNELVKIDYGMFA